MTATHSMSLLEAILRNDYLSFTRKVFHTLCPGQTFVPDWYLTAIAYQLERVRRGEVRRLVINLPPRSLKSIMVSVAFPAFLLGHDPTRRIICASYSSDLAGKLSNDFRAVLNSAWYRSLFPATRIGRKDSESEVALTRRGFRLATSVGGTLTGRGGDILIIDDPLKPLDAVSESKRNAVNDWFANTLLSRLDSKIEGAIIIVMQRVHMDDLTGFLLRQSDEWEVLALPAIAEGEEEIPIGPGRFHRRRLGEVLSSAREPLEILEEIKRQLGSDLFSAQYQQAPVPPGGAMVKRAWLKYYPSLPELKGWPFVIQSWDTATKGGPDNDWSVCTTWMLVNGTLWYLIDLWRDRVDYPHLKAKVKELAQRFHANEVLIEDAGSGTFLMQELNGAVCGLIGVKPEHDKATRMAAASAKIEAGQVFFPERAPWLPDLEAELLAFPGSRYDDQVDSISQALNHHSGAEIWFREWPIARQRGVCGSAILYAQQRRRHALRYR